MIKELHEKLKNKEITAEALTKQYLDTIDTKEPELDAFLSIRREKALEEAAQIDVKIQKGEDVGILAGIPYAAKDNMCVTGEIVTAASKILENYTVPYTATVIARLQNAGAVLLGKTNMDEFAMGSSGETSAYKLTKNPHDTTRVPGGSSSGSATSVTAGEAPFALGSDTGGSIRQPASLCGNIGLKPTYGRVSRNGIIAMASSLDQVGTFTQTAEDAAIILEYIAGEDNFDATSAESPGKNYTSHLTGDIQGMKIGIPKEYLEQEGLDPDIRKRFEESLDIFRAMGAIIEDISLPYSKYALSTYYIIMPSEVSSNMARYDGIKYGLSVDKELEEGVKSKLQEVYTFSRARGLGAEVKRRIMTGTYTLSAGYYDAYYKKAQKVRNLIKQDFERAFQKVDLIYGPTSPEVAFKFGTKTDDPLTMYLSDIYTVTANMAGVPGISFPIGMVQTDGVDLPVGGQFMGKWFDEEGILRAVDAFERR